MLIPNTVIVTIADEVDPTATISYNPGQTIRGIGVILETPTHGTDVVSGITFGGNALTRYAEAHDNTTDPGSAYFYYDGTSLASGTQNIVITVVGSTSIRGFIFSVLADTDTAVIAAGSQQENQANPQVVLYSGSKPSFVVAGVYSGLNAVSNLVDLAKQTRVQSDDFGTHITVSSVRTYLETNWFTIGWTGAIESTAMAAGAVYEIGGAPPANTGGGGDGFGPVNSTPIMALPTGVVAYTGTGASTLEDVTSAGSGTYTPPAITGTGASTLADATSAGSGTYTPAAITGTGASTLDDVTSAGDGTFTPLAITGTGASTLEDVTSAGSGTVTNFYTGTGASTLGDVTSAGAGTFTPAPITGTGASTLEDVTSAGDGSFIAAITGTGSSTLSDVTSAGDGTFIEAITGTGASTLEDVTSTGSGFLGVNGTGSSTLGDVTSVGDGLFAEAITGTGTSTLEDVTSYGVGVFTSAGAFAGAGSSTLDNVTSAGAGTFTPPAAGARVRRHPDEPGANRSIRLRSSHRLGGRAARRASR